MKAFACRLFRGLFMDSGGYGNLKYNMEKWIWTALPLIWIISADSLSSATCSVCKQGHYIAHNWCSWFERGLRQLHSWWWDNYSHRSWQKLHGTFTQIPLNRRFFRSEDYIYVGIELQNSSIPHYPLRISWETIKKYINLSFTSVNIALHKSKRILIYKTP